jgi:hypothetical protein
MKNPIFAASHERGVKLRDAGCPFDFPGALPRHSFRVEPLPGYVYARVYELGPLDTGYVIPLRLNSDRSLGTIITDWSFEPPWPDHFIDWDYGPEDFIPKKDQYEYSSFSKSPLMKVLNYGLRIGCGRPVEGLLCGHSNQPIGESCHGFISAKLSFTDDRGNTVPLCINLNVESLRHASASQLPAGATRPRVFARHPEFGALDQGGKPEEALPVWLEMPEIAEAAGDAETINAVRTRLTDPGQ